MIMRLNRKAQAITFNAFVWIEDLLPCQANTNI